MLKYLPCIRIRSELQPLLRLTEFNTKFIEDIEPSDQRGIHPNGVSKTDSCRKSKILDFKVDDKFIGNKRRSICCQEGLSPSLTPVESKEICFRSTEKTSGRTRIKQCIHDH